MLFFVMLFVPFFALIAVILFVLLRIVYFWVCSYLLFLPDNMSAKAKARIGKMYFRRHKITVEGPPDVGVPWHLSLGKPPNRLFIAFCGFENAMAESYWSDINKWQPTLKGHLFSVLSTSPWPRAALLHAQHFGIPVFRQSDLPEIAKAFSFPPATLHQRILRLSTAGQDVGPSDPQGVL